MKGKKMEGVEKGDEQGKGEGKLKGGKGGGGGRGARNGLVERREGREGIRARRRTEGRGRADENR